MSERLEDDGAADPPIDASELVVEEIVVDDENYEEIIILDLRLPERHLWLM